MSALQEAAAAGTRQCVTTGDRVTQHLHTEYVDGCYRCELSRDDTIADDAVAEGRAWRPSLHTCPHRVENATAGQCERCHRAVIANGCGPGFVFAS